MDFYKNQLNRVNGAMPMMPTPANDYVGGGGGAGMGNLLGRMPVGSTPMH
jgi:hypothetical protein